MNKLVSILCYFFMKNMYRKWDIFVPAVKSSSITELIAWFKYMCVRRPDDKHQALYCSNFL